jgi:hypothetical protein
MSNRKFIKQLEVMKGKTFQYGNQIHCIIDYKIEELHEKVMITTNLKTFDRPYDSCDEFLSYWMPVNSVEVTTTQDKEVDTYRVTETSLMDSLVTTLKDSIEKVQKDKSYIQQATAINNNINTIVNITKMKLDMFKQIKRMKD